ncbi:hypothetical protein NliqN6_6629 [Naganishia liquefaciens]|uniref:DNA excision repair protein ERCC-1 n=1 Tax=Naganishia liquefaciens TaxID=104408 RepID=A0A8H3U023_9TREE|nr:hypothetical protein NliqN6_6629 [Naganishia liquefaciens]
MPPESNPALPLPGSNRNASNAHLPLPPTTDPNPVVAPPSTAAAAVVGQDGQSAPKPGVNVNGAETDRDKDKQGATGTTAGTAGTAAGKPVNVPSGSKRSIVVNARQRGNPVLKAIQGVGWEYGDIVPDYQVGANTCVLYLSLKYHRLHPEYLHTRIEAIRGMYLLRVLLLMCDISEHQEPIREITKICLINEMTVITAWTTDEAATYLATYKAFEHKPPDMLKERTHRDYPGQLSSVLTSVRGVNKTDVITLGTNFGSFKNMTHATPEQLGLCPGLGEVKVRRLYDAFNLPFRVGGGTTKRVRGRTAASSTTTPTTMTTPTTNDKPSKSSSSTRKNEQLTLSHVGLSMGLGEAATAETNKRKRKREDEVVVLDDDDDDDEPVVQGSPDWPEMEEDEGEAGRGGGGGGGGDGDGDGVWRDPLASDSD